MEANENESTTVQILWGAAKAVLSRNTLQSRLLSRSKKGPKYRTEYHTEKSWKNISKESPKPAGKKKL